MAWIFGGKHYGQYTYEHWFDDEYAEVKKQDTSAKDIAQEKSGDDQGAVSNASDNTVLHKPKRRP